jgi:hypothetical protein
MKTRARILGTDRGALSGRQQLDHPRRASLSAPLAQDHTRSASTILRLAPTPVRTRLRLRLRLSFRTTACLILLPFLRRRRPRELSCDGTFLARAKPKKQKRKSSRLRIPGRGCTSETSFGYLQVSRT